MKRFGLLIFLVLLLSACGSVESENDALNECLERAGVESFTPDDPDWFSSTLNEDNFEAVNDCIQQHIVGRVPDRVS